MRGSDAFGGFVFIGVAAFEESHGGDGAEDPGEFGDGRDVGLTKKAGFAGVESTREKVHGQSVAVFPQAFGIVYGGERMEVSNKDKALRVVLQGEDGVHHAEVITEMKNA